jgi:hypothetical protein
MWAIGIFLAAFGPLFLLIPIWLISRFPLRWTLAPWLERRWGRRAGWIRHGLALVIVASVVFLTWLPGRIEYTRLCKIYQEPVIHRIHRADGFFREKMFAYEAERYLREWGFSWVEAPDPYRYNQRPRYLRYRKGPGTSTVVTEVPAPSADLSVSVTFEKLPHGLSLSLKRITVRATGEEIARAGSVSYDGGPLSIILGVYGTCHCPNPITAKGSKYFEDYYYLERKVMRGM